MIPVQYIDCNKYQSVFVRNKSRAVFFLNKSRADVIAQLMLDEFMF